MKILTIHADFIEFEAKKKAFKAAEEDVEKGKKEKVKECLVVFTAVEKRDEGNVKAIVKKYISEIKDIAKQVKAKNIVLYPYAHLSQNLGSPELAVKVLEESQKALEKQKFSVSRAPFGYYKSFEMKVKGHPLSELSREIKIEGGEEVIDHELLLIYTVTFEAKHLRWVYFFVRGEVNRTLVEADMIGEKIVEAEFKSGSASWGSVFFFENKE